MKIKRLEIIGFKSFVDKVVLDFPPGVTAIVGPNGCGKSNVVDAIRWVMGEQSAKNLRGRQMEDIIFGGSESRKPLGMAEVSLVFATDDGRVPAKYLNYSEIQVTRRLYRDGESEYFLNKTPCRLLDIAELFMDTGVGARAYSIIEQGRIGMILMAKPEDRRFLIEEAAGVTKFKARKQVALKKIETTRQNLLRLSDIVAEIRRQLNSLQRQAKKAERFRTCREELREIELFFAARRFAVLNENRERVAADLAGLTAQEGDKAADLTRRELALEERRLVLVEEEKGLAAHQEEIYRCKTALQSAESRQELHRKELAALAQQGDRVAEELARLERQLLETEAEQAVLLERQSGLAIESAGEEQSLASHELELAELLRTEQGAVARLEEVRRALFSQLGEISQCANQIQNAGKRLEGLSERAERNRREGVTLAERLTEAAQRTTTLEAGVATERANRESLQRQLVELRDREEHLKGESGTLEQELQSRRDERSRCASRLHSLQELEAQFAGYGQGVRTLLLDAAFTARFNGVVADVLEVSPDYEVALEAVLGERLQAVLAAGDSDVLAAVAHLRGQAGGRCSFVVGGGDAAVAGQPPTGTISLSSQVRVAEPFRAQLAPFLAETYVVPELALGLDLARQHPRAVFVTQAGDVAWGGGIVEGGAGDGGQPGLIHKKREMKELGREVALLEEQVTALASRREACRADLAATEEALRQARQGLHLADIALLNQEKDLQRVREEGERIRERLAVKELEDEQLQEERTLLERDSAEAVDRQRRAEGQKGELEAVLAGQQEALASQREIIGELRESVTALKVRVAALKEKREAAARAHERLVILAGELQQRLTRHREELASSGAARERLTGAEADDVVEVSSLVTQLATAEAAHGGQRARYEEAAALAAEEESLLKRLRADVDDLRRLTTETSLRQTELSLQLSHLETTASEKFRVDLATLVPAALAREEDETVLAARQAELQKQVDDMGEVNLTAIDEYRELDERHTFLTTQQADLEESLRALQQAIQRINRTTRRRFQETFELVNTKFQEVFPRLFCGGRAELRLTNEEDMLETGIDIIVQPPGKKLQNVSLLSGGEKALTAVALIFSIFLIKPSPFCLLDEVDAPLDDANIGRFNDMIREMVAFSQFILITHSKTTMAVADTLYGITMEEAGASKLVSVKLH
ncbi:MAG TPA: chromosome segregation protein SMC [Geobacteraceae bacterium]